MKPKHSYALVGDEDEVFHCPGGVTRLLIRYVIMERELSPLAPFNCAEPSKWDSWKRSFEYYIAAANITSESRKIAVLLHAGGLDLLEVYHSVVDADVKFETLKEVIYIFDKQF